MPSPNITYKMIGIDVRVYLDGAHVGTIRRSPNGFTYFPKGSKVGGTPSHSLAEVKRSLEAA